VARRLIWLVAACLCCGLVAAAPAAAGDANRVPPQIKLWPAGQEGFLGPRAEALAYFSTPDFGEADDSWRYAEGSKVTFSCTLDGRPTPCSAEHLKVVARGHESELVPLPSASSGERVLPGPYYGSVSLPENLSPGPHTVTVVATDEDGTDPNPPSVTVTVDQTPPQAPELTQVPPRHSWIRKPIFRFRASDDLRLVKKGAEPFTGSLRRLNPPGLVFKSFSSADSFLEVWGVRCPTLTTCSTRAQASYMVSEDWYSYGEPERLTPGRYELRVRVRDAVGNKSPLTTYRFRVLRGKPR
jgi:hypothetical protein